MLQVLLEDASEMRESMATRRGRIQLYVAALKVYLDALEADHAAIRARMQREADSGRLPYLFEDALDIQRRISAGKDPIDYARLVSGALLYMRKHMRTAGKTLDAAVAVYNDLPKWDPGRPETRHGLYLVSLPDEVFGALNDVTDFLIAHDVRIKFLARGTGTQIVSNLAVIFSGMELLKS